MSCPTQFHGVHLSIPDTFSGADFFSDNTVDHWQLEDYLDWKLPTGCNKKPDAYFLQSQYLLDLNNLKQSGCLPREVSRYVGNLIKENKRPAEQFSTWWNEVKKHSGKKIINNIIKENTISGDFNVNTAETMTVHSEKQQQPQQQSQPQQEELLFEEASPSVSATKRPPEDKVGASGKKSKTAKASTVDSSDTVAGPSSRPAVGSYDHLDDLEKAWVSLQEEHDFLTNAHKYRLEKRGIIQCGRGLSVVPGVPEHIYALINLNSSVAPQLSLDIFGDYIWNVMELPTYGTFDCTDVIYDKTALIPDYPKDEFVFISRVLQLFSDSIHHRLKPCNLTDSETAYCHFGIWPLLNQVVNQIQYAYCRFLVGETKLNSTNDLATYLADGTVYIQDSNLEILLLEASGAYGNRDITRNAYDHVKGAFGLYTMIKAILLKYPCADPTLLNKTSVLFLHASSRDNNIRLWRMAPTKCGKLLLLERLDKSSICLDPGDVGAMINLMQFLWSVKFHTEQAIAGVKALKASHGKRISSNQYRDLPPLVSYIHPTAIKPKKTESVSRMCDLDPVSFL